MTLMLMLTLCGNTVGSMSQPQTKEALLHSRTDTQPEPEIRKRFQLFKKAMKTKSKQLRKENRGRAGKAALLAAGISLMTLAITAVAGLQSFFAVLIFSLAAIVGLIFGVVGIIRAKEKKMSMRKVGKNARVRQL